MVVLSICQGSASLMVDNLLAAAAIGAAALAAATRKAPRPWLLAVVLATLCLIKDSGLYFALLALAVYGFFLRRNHHSLKALLPPIALPVLVRAAWWIHIKTSFTAAALTKHAFTLANMESVSANRTWDNLLSIGKAVIRSVLSRHNHVLLLLLLMTACCAVIVLLRYFRTHRISLAGEGTLLLGASVSHGFYLLLLLGMYFLTMPLKGALQAVAFERYNVTFALFLYGLFAVYLLLIPPDSLPCRRLMPAVLVVMLALPLALPGFRGGIPRLLTETYRVPVREQIDTLEQIRPLRPSETGALYLGSQSLQEDFVSYIAAYTFQQKIPLYTAATLDTGALPDVLYALETDDVLRDLSDRQTMEVVTLVPLQP